MNVDRGLWSEAMLALRKSIAVYELLHAHAAGQTDLTEDQLANVVTVVSGEAKETLALARGRPVPEPRLSTYRGLLARRAGRGRSRRPGAGQVVPRLDS